jgi:hypothetical protein
LGGEGRGGRGGWVKKCFLSLRQTALLSAEGKKDYGDWQVSCPDRFNFFKRFSGVIKPIRAFFARFSTSYSGFAAVAKRKMLISCGCSHTRRHLSLLYKY